MIVYTVEEVKTDVITGEDTETTYAIAITGSVADGFTVTNTHTPVPTSVSVKKVWEDADNQDGIRPDKIIVILSNGTEVTLSEENEWTATVEDLPKYADGEEIEYTWTEKDLPEGYELTNTEVEGLLTILTNTHTPDERDLTVIKVWADDNNYSKKRPASVEITLLANGKEYDRVVLSESNDWRHTFTELPVNDDGEKITYSVLEEIVPEDYEVAYEETEEGFIIHNVLGKGGDNPPPDNPQTGDNILLYLVTLLISIVGFVGSKIIFKENN